MSVTKNIVCVTSKKNLTTRRKPEIMHSRYYCHFPGLEESERIEDLFSQGRGEGSSQNSQPLGKLEPMTGNFITTKVGAFMCVVLSEA
jgi:hypothetical protein